MSGMPLISSLIFSIGLITLSYFFNRALLGSRLRIDMLGIYTRLMVLNVLRR